jgi:hypothetical protein
MHAGISSRRGPERLAKSSFLVVASFVFAIVTGSLAFRVLFRSFPSIDFDSNPAPGLITVGFPLLLSGYAYRRWCFTTMLDCAVGLSAYLLAAIVFVSYATGADAVAGFLDGWLVWLVIAPLAPWTLGFFVARRGQYRSRKRA